MVGNVRSLEAAFLCAFFLHLVALSAHGSAGDDDRKETAKIPKFNTNLNKTLVTSADQTIYLHCQIDDLGDRSVSWIRRSDLKILTIGEVLYTEDSRFSPIHENGSNIWVLKLSHAKVEDSGEYECQVSYHDDKENKLTMTLKLDVLDSRAFIQTSADLHVQMGSTLSLGCSVFRPSAPPNYVYWYRNDGVLNYSPSVNIEEEFGSGISDGQEVSRLLIRKVSNKNSGNYTCAPSNAASASVVVHVVNDENGPAAMQRGNSVQRGSGYRISTLITLVAVAYLWR